MSFWSEGGGPGDGCFPRATNAPVMCKNATGETLTKGMHAALDWANSQAGSTQPGGVPGTSIYNTVVDAVVTAASGAFYPIMICIDDSIASGASGRFVRATGRILCNVDGACVAGSLLVCAADHQMDIATGAAGTQGQRVIGIAVEADTANIAMVNCFAGDPSSNPVA